MNENPFEKALEVLDNLGWTQHLLQSDDGRVCVLGSYSVANDFRTSYGRLMYPENPVVRHVRSAILSAGWEPPPRGNEVDEVTDWNDQPERTEEDVRLVLKHAAAAWTS